MSDIIRARELIQSVIDDMRGVAAARRTLRRALRLMYREPPCQHVRGKPQRITPQMRRRIRALRGKHTIHSIANIVGLRNSGRVSEVLHGKR